MTEITSKPRRRKPICDGVLLVTYKLDNGKTGEVGLPCIQKPRGHRNPHRKLLRAGPLGESQFVQFTWNGKGKARLDDLLNLEIERQKKRAESPG